MSARNGLLLGAVSLVALCWNATPAGAALYGFTPVSFHSGSAANAVAAQLSLEVVPSGPNALFTFMNDGPVQSTITGTYFDDEAGILDSLLAPLNGPGVRFKSGGAPANLPAPTVPYHFQADFRATAKSPRGLGKNGVDNPGELVTIPFALEGGKSFADVLAAVNAGLGDPTCTAGSLRVGIHVQSIGTADESDAFILTGAHAPLPGAVLLGMIGLSAAGLALRRFA
jgi:hypothetical protein